MMNLADVIEEVPALQKLALSCSDTMMWGKSPQRWAPFFTELRKHARRFVLDPEAVLELAACCSLMGDVEGALEVLRDRLRDYPSHAGIRGFYAELTSKAGPNWEAKTPIVFAPRILSNMLQMAEAQQVLRQNASLPDSWCAYAQWLMAGITIDPNEQSNAGDCITAAGEAAVALESTGQSEVARELLDRVRAKWPHRSKGLNDAIAEAKERDERFARAVEAGRQRITEPAAPTCRTVWLYWEGPKPAWIAACHETIKRHGGDVRILSPEEFAELHGDGDIDLAELAEWGPVHRSDYMRIFLLHKFGGLWLDSDCIAMRDLEPVIDELQRFDFCAMRSYDGVHPLNCFLSAKPGSEAAAALYVYVTDRMRAGGPLRWDEIGANALMGILRHTKSPWCEVPMEWAPLHFMDAGLFFTIGTPEQHEARSEWREQAALFMLTNTKLTSWATHHPDVDLLAEGTFFRWLLKRSEAAQ